VIARDQDFWWAGQHIKLYSNYSILIASSRCGAKSPLIRPGRQIICLWLKSIAVAASFFRFGAVSLRET
jgi:hypothetical protein